MAKKISTFALLFLLVIFQISFFPNLFFGKAVPNFVMVILIFLSARQGFREVWLKTIAAGFLLDIFSFYPIGINIIALLSVILMTSYLARRFLVTHMAWRFLILIWLIIAATILNDSMAAILVKIFVNSRDPLLNFNWNFAVKILSNVLVFCVIYWPLKKYEKLKNFYQQGAVLKDNAG